MNDIKYRKILKENLKYLNSEEEVYSYLEYEDKTFTNKEFIKEYFANNEKYQNELEELIILVREIDNNIDENKYIEYFKNNNLTWFNVCRKNIISVKLHIIKNKKHCLSSRVLNKLKKLENKYNKLICSIEDDFNKKYEEGYFIKEVK